mmetsp:Transcript_71529/g.159059  ORF Transcript_71529/g.159059 Transcript_71529/m.159059 type:complete len:198 (-) Transcript_71529:554-1147(-)|eukprot:CAMPEP_0181205564 /NCGR_PEP_ID=MMETSP1096-20121128/20550_1 /TAXON_ID=156174 ORGANISM="Chrysochromulina ericina, Strain CCMP281" /NCGR_SAMPLE_ID=MMETSP1096 /ASSEMBLY_ACC=CAM_ASM_000453 /LENGTH=197 /DNA_ID=CAMNT_0023296367 /DNA_START=39 /DNA_END=632 /DNA_ORIENTATION=+
MAAEMQGWLKKKSPKTQGKRVLDVWQKRFFVLSAGELKYFKNEKDAFLSNSQPLKAIPLHIVLCAQVNPKHTDMFVVDLGNDKKVKLQATSERDRDNWVAALESAKMKAWTAEEERASFSVLEEARRSREQEEARRTREESGKSDGSSTPKPGGGSPAKKAAAFGSPASPDRFYPASSGNDELLRQSSKKQSCCIIS